MKRSIHTIVSQILGICDGGASKTNIVYEANLNSKIVNPYIEMPTKNGLIESINGRIIYDRPFLLPEGFSQALRHICPSPPFGTAPLPI